MSSYETTYDEKDSSALWEYLELMKRVKKKNGFVKRIGSPTAMRLSMLIE